MEVIAMKRKAWVMLLISVLVLSLIAGCSGNNAVSNVNDKKKEEDESSTPAASNENNEEKPTIKILGFYANLDPNDDPLLKEIEEKTGYKVEYSMLPQDNPSEKLNLEVASGTNYDILILDPDQFRQLASQGALMPLDDLIEQHGKNMSEVILQDSWDLTNIEGKTYGIPQKNERATVNGGMVIRQDLLDQAGLSKPETLEDFHNMLQTFKEEYPDMIPMTGSGMEYLPILSAFGLGTDWTEVNGELVPRIKMPGMKDYLTFMRDLYNDELLDQDLGINQGATRDEKFAGGKAAVTDHSWNNNPKVKQALIENNPDATLSYVGALEGPNGEIGVAASRKLLRVHAIPKNSENAEHVIKFIDSKLQKDTFTYLTLGEKDVTFTQEGDKFAPIMPIFSEVRGTAWYFLNGIDEIRYPDMWLARLRRDADLFEMFEQVNANYEKIAKSDPTAFIPTLDAPAKYTQSLNKMAEDFQIKVVMGAESIDNLDDFIEKWEEAGGAEVVNEVNEWYSSNK
jgi:putative aldouronate transport system substrate-binding protein